MGSHVSRSRDAPKQPDPPQKPEEETTTDPPTILFLGAGSSGKSTFLRNARELGNPLTESERSMFAPILRYNACWTMRVVLDALGRPGGLLDSSELTDEEKASAVQALWNDPVVQSTIYRPDYVSKGNGVEERLFALLPEMASPDWIPTPNDIMISRVRTTGIVVSELQLGGHMFKTCDVGGQREERKKWIHCFSTASAVVFFFGLGAFQENLFEDDSTNKLAEDFQLWKEIAQSRFLKDKHMVVVFNKMDRFPTMFIPSSSSSPSSSSPSSSSSASPSSSFFSPSNPVLPSLRAALSRVLLPALVDMVVQYSVRLWDKDSVCTLEAALEGKLQANESPYEFAVRRVLSVRADTLIVPCDSTDSLSVHTAADLIGNTLHHMIRKQNNEEEASKVAKDREKLE